MLSKPTALANRRGGWMSRESFANIFVPKIGMFGDEASHQFDAAGVVENFKAYTAAADIFFGALEGSIFSSDDPWNFV